MNRRQKKERIKRITDYQDSFGGRESARQARIREANAVMEEARKVAERKRAEEELARALEADLENERIEEARRKIDAVRHKRDVQKKWDNRREARKFAILNKPKTNGSGGW